MTEQQQQQLAIKVRQVADSINLDDAFDSFEYLDPRLAQEFAKRLLAALPASEQKPIGVIVEQQYCRDGFRGSFKCTEVDLAEEIPLGTLLYTHCPDSAARIKELEEDVERLRAIIDEEAKDSGQVIIERDNLKEKLRVARETMQFVSDLPNEDNYRIRGLLRKALASVQEGTAK